MRQESLLAIAFALPFCVPGAAQVQLCAPAKVAALRAELPATTNPEWQALFHDAATLFYSDEEMPAAYQFRGGFHLARHNLSGEPTEPFGNANREFPWRTPGGIDQAEEKVAKFTFLHLPAKEDGGRWPIVYWREVWSDRGDPSPLLLWIFPIDTTIGECLLLVDSRGARHAFEVRLRIRRPDGWGVEILRPYPTVDSLLAKLEQLGTDEARQVAAQLREVRAVPLGELRDPRPRAFVTFAARAPVETLPPMSETLAAELLAAPFQEAAGVVWRETVSHESDVISPTSSQDFSIVPKGYTAAFLGNDSTGCANCHKHTLLTASEIQPFRDWYGHVRGSADGIFSFHPVAPSSLSNNGFVWPVRLRPQLTPLLEAYDPEKHPADRYTFVELGRQ